MLEETRGHALAERWPAIGSFLSVPIVLSDGGFAGTLCAADPEARTLRAEQVGLVVVLARLVATYLEREERALEREARAQLEGVLLAARTFEHELFNTLSAVLGRAQLLARRSELPPPARGDAERVVEGAQKATHIIQRLLELTSDDFRVTDWGTTTTIDVAPPGTGVSARRRAG